MVAVLLVADVASGLVLAAVVEHHHAPAPAPARVRSVVVSAQCTDGHVVDGVNDGDRAGLLAVDTGVAC